MEEESLMDHWFASKIQIELKMKQSLPLPLKAARQLRGLSIWNAVIPDAEDKEYKGKR